ncbi:hypothetical protein LZP85_09685 [Priestia flexa]|jgi:hypothetical protein|uniref:Uncharacterized protein n=1 Tax=Priestia flexa TaxID=86664 RepID=A0A1N6Z9F3_9BACI|nr:MULTISPECIES: hypothetical protein [Bacillaceae]KZB90974.1 hypothetical protein A2U94_13195 [Bacillus sp. VT 712]MBN8252161.1 hypothetical protein [Priestia flexa]MBN8435106.1 hypothetical protein [Priestia flexa]MCA0967392.1 hypothetical protein [Priestia flexa]MCA1201927.1 hypothetical protein [Priestia flexa]
MNTLELHYHIYQDNVKVAEHYLPWAFSMIESDYESTSLYILAALQKPYNIFEAEHYFRRAVEELELKVPTEQECTTYVVYKRLEELINQSDDLFNKVYDLSTLIIYELDSPKQLASFVEISDLIDDFLYGDNYLKLTETMLKEEILRRAEKLIKSVKELDGID